MRLTSTVTVYRRAAVRRANRPCCLRNATIGRIITFICVTRTFFASIFGETGHKGDAVGVLVPLAVLPRGGADTQGCFQDRRLRVILRNELCYSWNNASFTTLILPLVLRFHALRRLLGAVLASI